MTSLPVDISSYQLLIANRADVTVTELCTACEWLQKICQQDPENIGSLKLLEQLLLAYYEQAYPHTFGGIFEPLTKVIGYTHCHYLDPIKFQAFERNQFWLKFNILTNTVEWLPDDLQPTSIGEMMHVLHLITYIKNRYYDKHSVSLILSNKEHLVWWVFVIQDDKLIISRDDEISTPQLQGEYTLSYPSCDVIIHSWNSFPTLAAHKQVFADHLNLWGNEALEEIYISEVKLPEWRTYLKYNTVMFTMWTYQEAIKNEFSNIHFTRWILKLQEATGKSRKETGDLYQSYLDKYLEQKDAFDQVFFVSNALPNQHDHAFSSYYQHLRPLLRDRYDNFTDYSPDSLTYLPKPTEILHEIIGYIKTFPQKRCLITIWLHGQQDGSAVYEGGSFFKEWFQTLFDLASTYPHIQLLIMSCRSAKKTDKLLGNIIMSSSDQVSYGTYSNFFVESFGKWESLYQAHLYAMTKYHQSLLPTSFWYTPDESVELCPVGKEQSNKPV